MNPREINSALGPALDGRTCREGPGGTVIIENLPPDAWLPFWRALRGAVDQTGRWPVATTVWDTVMYSEPDWVEPARTVDEEVGDVSADGAAAFQAAVEQTNPWSVYETHWRDYELPPSDVQYYLAPADRERFGRQPPPDLAPPYTTGSVGRWTYDRVVADPNLLAGTDLDWFASEARWFIPDNVALVLLPTPDPWMAPCWFSYWGAQEPARQVALAAAEREWHAKWRAERAASWSTMIQFLAAKPPTSPSDAWTLAGQILAIASSNDEHQWMLAYALLRGHFWFLHNRP